MIKIIKGTYGHVPNPKAGIVVPKTSKDEPFSLSPEQEKRLVSLGVAEYVNAAPEAEPETEPAEDMTPEAEEAIAAALGDMSEAEDDEPEGPTLEDMTAKELREYGKTLGLTLKVGMTKAEMREAIEAALDDTAEAEDDEAPPTFDAAEAVK